MKYLKLSNTNEKAMIDDDDFQYCEPYSWYLEPNGYVRTNMHGKKVYLHRFVMNAMFVSRDVDHKDGDKLNCTKQNLRLVKSSQNNANRTLPDLNKGVKQINGKWQAKITYEGVSHLLGEFDDEWSAKIAWNKKAKELDPLFFKMFLIDDNGQMGLM